MPRNYRQKEKKSILKNSHLLEKPEKSPSPSLSTLAISQTAQLTDNFPENPKLNFQPNKSHILEKNTTKKHNLLKSNLYDVTCVPVMGVKTRT